MAGGIFQYGCLKKYNWSKQYCALPLWYNQGQSVLYKEMTQTVQHLPHPKNLLRRRVFRVNLYTLICNTFRRKRSRRRMRGREDISSTTLTLLTIHISVSGLIKKGCHVAQPAGILA